MTIDYGASSGANRNPETSIHYGLISLNSLEDWIYDELDQLPNPTLDEALADYCRDRLCELIEEGSATPEDFDLEPEDDLDEYVASLSDENVTLALSNIEDLDPFYYGLDSDYPGKEGVIDGVTVRVTELGGALLLWVLDSPHVGNYAMCSPCAPGAGDLDTPDPNGYPTYDVPAEWRAAQQEDSQ